MQNNEQKVKAERATIKCKSCHEKMQYKCPKARAGQLKIHEE